MRRGVPVRGGNGVWKCGIPGRRDPRRTEAFPLANRVR